MPRGVNGVVAIVGVAGNILARALLSRLGTQLPTM